MIRRPSLARSRRPATFWRGSTVRGGALALVGMLAALGAAARPAVPVALVYDTPLKKGEWTISYVYERIEGAGLRKGSSGVGSNEVKSATISQVPIATQTEIHTLGLQHAPFERLTLALSLPLLNQKMRQRNFDTGADPYTSHASGVGDLELVGLVPFMQKGEETLDFHLGLRFPTGEIKHKDEAGNGQRVSLPFPVQPGARTFSILSGFTYRGYWQRLGWGVQGAGSIGFGDNSRGFRVGNHLSFSGWLAHDLTSILSGSFRLGFDRRWRLRGADRAGPANHLASYRSASAGRWLSVSPGLSVALPGMAGQRLSVEASWPVYQSYKGPQVERDWSLTSGWEWVF